MVLELFIFLGVVLLELYYGSQIPVTTGGSEPQTFDLQ